MKINAMPEMSALAWLRVRENLVSRGRLEAVRGAFCMSASQALVNSLLAITDPVVAESFFARVRNEFLPRFGFAEDDVVESARVFFDDPGPLRAFMERLAQEKDNSRRVRARLIEYSGELSRIKGSRAWRFMSFFSRLFDGGGLRDASRQT